MAGFIIYLLLAAAALYLVLALGVDLISRFAPIHRKPVLNAALLCMVVILFLWAAAIGSVRF